MVSDLASREFGCYTVLGRALDPRGNPYVARWRVRCFCGYERTFSTAELWSRMDAVCRHPRMSTEPPAAESGRCPRCRQLLVRAWTVTAGETQATRCERVCVCGWKEEE